MLQYKKCSKCGKEKPKTEFYEDRRHRGGLYTWCRLCHLIVTNAYKRVNKDLHNKQNRDYYHRIQEEAGVGSDPRYFYPGYRFLKALQEL